MTRKTSSMVRGIGAAVALGGAVAVISSMHGGGRAVSRRKIKKTAMKAAQTVENVLDGLQSLM